MKKSLNPALASIIHYIELNKAGWWRKSVQNLILATFWETDKPLGYGELISHLKTNYLTSVEYQTVQKQVGALQKSGELVELKDDKYKISEYSRNKIKSEIDDAQNLEKKVKDLFTRVLNGNCPDLEIDGVWESFQNHFLLPLIKEFGANTYTLVTGGSLTSNPERLEIFLKEFPPERKSGLQQTAEVFLHPHNKDVSNYILRLLNGYFFVEATNLSEETVRLITKATKRKPTFIIYIDTNFLLSILDLREDDSDDSATILDLIGNISNLVNVELRVLPITMDEIKRVLISKKTFLSSLRLPSNLMEVALKTQNDSIVRRFLLEKKRKGLISADQYFRPYLEDFKSVIRSKGLIFDNDNLDRFRQTNSQIADDINSTLEFEQERYKDKAKNVDKLAHDIMLWHFVQSKRDVRVESPLEAKHWIVTLDTRLLGFDNYKKRTKQSIPICIHPTNLIQMFQFWVPRTEQFDEVMLNTLRLPLLLQNFDPNSERTTLKVIEALGAIENIADMDENTLSEIMINRALRNKLEVSHEQEEKLKLVREALIDIHNRRMKEKENENQRLRNVIDTKEKDEKNLQIQINVSQNQFQTKNTENEELKEKNKKLEEEVKVMKQGNERIKFLGKWVVLPLIIISILFVLTAFIINYSFNLSLKYSMMVAFVPWSIIMLRLVFQQGQANEFVKDSWAFSLFQKFWYGVLIIVNLIYQLVLGVTGNAVFEMLKRFLNQTN